MTTAPADKKIALWNKVAENNYSSSISNQEQQLAQQISHYLSQLDIKSNASLLELGSGSGHLSCLLAKEGFQVNLADFSEVALDKSKILFAENQVDAQFYLLDIFKANTLSQQFDVTWNSGVMEHFTEEELSKLFTCFAQITKKYFLCIVPNPKSLPYLLFRYKSLRENNWLFGTEFLRENYKEIAENAGWSLIGQHFLGMEYSIDHMNYFNGQANPLYEELVNNGLLPDSEAYLTLYIFEKRTSTQLPCKVNNAQTEFKTLHFDFIAEMQKNNNILYAQLNQITGEKNELKTQYQKVQQELNDFKSTLFWKLFRLKKIAAKALPIIQYILHKIYKKLPFKYQKPLKKIALRFRYKHQIQLTASSANTDKKVIDWLESLLQHTDTSRLVVCLQSSFFTPDGRTCYNGGAERYLVDLAEIFVKNKYNFWIIQCAERQSWVQRHKNVLVVGLPSLSNQPLFLNYAAVLVEKAALFIASPFSYASHFNTTKTYTIGISHGVYWDRPELNSTHIQPQLVSALEKINHLVSVDTSTINVIRTFDQALCSDKITYIPNYVDPSFKEVHCELPISINQEDIVVLFPRRLHEARGFYLVIDVVKEAFQHHNSLIFVFCGHGDTQEINVLNTLKTLYPNRIYHFTLPPEEMYAAYKIADIVLIPTIYSEGTSLSCIEAMESQKAIIATCLGGLTDLIIDEYSGLLVKPNKEKVLEGLLRLIADKNLRTELAKNALAQAKCFTKKRWQNQWESIIRQIPGYQPSAVPAKSIAYTLLHPSTFLVYEVMKQRPQHLFDAFAHLGIPCMYVDALPHTAPRVIRNNLFLLDKDSQINYSNYCVYTYYPYHYNLFTQSKPQILIYDVLDSPEIHQSKEALICHEQMLATADIIITSSRLLYEQYKRELKQQEIHYVPNAACPESLQKQPKAADFPNFKQKTIGYYGAIAEWFDFELLEKTCLELPECQILLIGPCRQGYPEFRKLNNLLKKYENLFYLGLKPYEELAQYAHYFDVAIIPFLENEITKNCSPVKLFEYMNMHKPIVTTEMPECRYYQAALVAHNHGEFIDLINKALKLTPQEEYFTIMKKEARENTWNTRATIIHGAIQRVYAQNTQA